MVVAIALVVRALVVGWAGSRIPPVADATFYHRIATRIAEGHGYTWLWPDGAVTYAAHYPVGYPALLGLSYWVAGAEVAIGMWVNAILGAAGAAAVHRLVLRGGGERRALVAGLLAALHPALLLYTPALMTEGVVASMMAIAALAAVRVRERSSWGRLVVLGAVVGLTTLIRPQALLVAPLFAAVALAPALRGRPSLARGLGGVVVVTATALLVCLPWTLRNCVRMDRCALVSVNGGWNLLIGASEGATGTWAPVRVPDACLTVFAEAAKDQCFEREAHRTIAADPVRFVMLMPAKLAATFDYVGAGPWYLHAANPEAFSQRAKEIWGGLETVLQRGLLIAALLAAAVSTSRARGRPAMPDRARWVRWGAGALGVVASLHLHAWVAYVALALCLGLAPAPRDAAGRETPLFGLAAVVIASTGFVHAVFFGSGRYALVVFPLVIAVAALARLPARAAEAKGSDFDMTGPTPAS